MSYSVIFYKMTFYPYKSLNQFNDFNSQDMNQIIMVGLFCTPSKALRKASNTHLPNQQ